MKHGEHEQFSRVRSSLEIGVGLAVGAIATNFVYDALVGRTEAPTAVSVDTTTSSTTIAQDTPEGLITSLGSQSVFICEIRNSDGTTSEVTIDINGPETPVQIASILGGTNMLNVLLDGVDAFNADLDASLAAVVGNEVQVIDTTGVLTPTESWYLEYKIINEFNEQHPAD